MLSKWLFAVFLLFLVLADCISKRDIKWKEVILPAFTTYKDIHGNLLIPDNFKVPEESPWPETSWGTNIGSIVSSIRTRDTWSEKKTELLSLGFEYRNVKDVKWEGEIVPALVSFKDIYGHLNIPAKFVVPDTDASDAWPKETHGLKLGAIASTLRRKDVWRDKRPWLQSLGFDYAEPRIRRWQNQVFPAFKKYFETYGHVNIPTDYKSDNVNLGVVACLIRTRGDWLDVGKADLESIGFDFRKVSDIRWSEIIAPALKYYQLLNGDMLVPAHFVVPATDQWSKDLHGLKLGNIVSHIRSLSNWSDKRDDLEKMGFQFGDILQLRWMDEILPAFKVYERIHGSLNVPIDFVVPGTHPWPISSHGLHLGSIVDAIRTHGVKHNKKSKIEDLGFDVVQDTFLDWILGTKVEDWRDL
jgi:hypothetical protein